MKSHKVLAIIPARGGSKGIPRKNILSVLGKPLITWTIEQAKKSNYIDKILVSTDDDEIARISREAGAEVPFMRPAELAGDTAQTIDVLLHAIDFLESKKEIYDILVLLEPTSPLRDADDIDLSLTKLLKFPEAKSIVSVAKLECTHPAFNVIINKQGYLRKPDGNSDFSVLRRQDLSDIYYFEGTIYISYISALKEKRTFYHDKTLPYIVPKYKSFELDDAYDFICIEALLKAKIEDTLP